MRTLAHVSPSRLPTRRSRGARAFLLVAAISAVVLSAAACSDARAGRSERAAPGRAGTPAPGAEGGPGTPGAGGAGDLGTVAEQVLSGVVSVEVGEDGHAGFGFRVAVDRIVVTSARAVGDAEKVRVVPRDRTRRSARVLGRAPEVDVAVLELDDDAGLPPMHSGSGLAEARAGDRVLVVASPLTAPDPVVPTSLRATAVTVRLESGAELPALQTGSPIEVGDDGGPLVDARGQVLGVTTAVATPRGRSGREGLVGAGFAIPVDVARSASLAIVARSR